MTTLYAYWDLTKNALVSHDLIDPYKKGVWRKLINLIDEEDALDLVDSGDVVITEVEIKRLIPKVKSLLLLGIDFTLTCHK